MGKEQQESANKRDISIVCQWLGLIVYNTKTQRREWEEGSVVKSTCRFCIET